MNITEIIDKHLNHWKKKGGNFTLDPLPKEMFTGEFFDEEDEVKYWKPIESSVTQEQIKELEKEFNTKFPSLYKQLLLHKHFIELHIGQVSIFSHPSEGWQNRLRKRVLDGWPKEDLIEKGLLPFADYNDWGLLCFDTNEESTPIILWDHEVADQKKLFAEDLVEALKKEEKNT